MASGAFRPYTAEDIIGSLSDSIGALSSSSTSAGTGFVLEADETAGLTDAATVATLASPAWSQGQWGTFIWQ